MSRKLRIPVVATALVVSFSLLAVPPAAHARSLPTFQEAITWLASWLTVKSPSAEGLTNTKPHKPQPTSQGTADSDIGCGIDPNGIPLCQP